PPPLLPHQNYWQSGIRKKSRKKMFLTRIITRKFTSKLPCLLRNYSTSTGTGTGTAARMRIQFKCIAPSTTTTTQTECGHLNTHEFSSQAFNHGIVLVQCPSCSNRHLIADHLQWFTSNKTSDDPNFKQDHKTIIDLMRAKGEIVKRGQLTSPSEYKLTTNTTTHSDDQGEVLEYVK
ncbi:hypothetical protein MJO28_009278, partial [Puccinia striiformis f. sp. tritici]